MSASPQHAYHQINYVEIPVRDLESAKKFYSEAFGWEFNDYGPAYAGIRGGSGEVGGLCFTEGHRGRAGAVLVILFSDALEESVESVRSAGGAVTNGPYAFPGGRRFHFTDPSGNELAVWSAK